MFTYCFEFSSAVALSDGEQVGISECIRCYSDHIGGIQIKECAGVVEKPVFDTVLDEAKHLIHGDRNSDYGHPLDDFNCTAAMWTAYLRHRGLLKPGVELVAEDVAMMMINIKQSRYANAPKRDCIVDIAGYAGTIDMCAEKRLVINRVADIVDKFPPVDDVVGD